MSRKRMPLCRLVMAAGPVCLQVLALVGVSGCDKYATLKTEPVDCTADDGYDFSTISDFENVGDNVFWGAGDNTPGHSVGDDASQNVYVETIPDGPRCDSKAAAVLRAAHNDDWGCLFGSNNLGAPRDASQYEGLSFWARAPDDPATGATTKGFVILLDDPNTAVINNIGNCKNVSPPPGSSNTLIIVSVDGQSVSTSSGVTRPINPDECGNSYSVVMLVTSEWAFYTIPFSRFQQDPKPNRVPNALLTQVGNVPGTGLLTNQLLNLIIRFPKEANAELWLDSLSFYRTKVDAGHN